ncbi:hypothetical protein ACP70R_044984 [Stipagrostis hirtigluma subsp. patula]
MSSSVASASSSSPPTPPSPLPVSVGSGLEGYIRVHVVPFPSPLFSPPGGPSPEASPLLRVVRSEPKLPFAFSMDTFAQEPSRRWPTARRFDLGA